MKEINSHLVFVNYASDFRNSVHRLNNGGIETYYGQNYSIDSISQLQETYEKITVVDCITDKIYDEVLPNGIRTVGLGLKEPMLGRDVCRVLNSLGATHIIIAHLLPSILFWSLRQKAKICVVSASGMVIRPGLKGWLQSRRLAHLLNYRRIRWVGAYGRNAARSFQAIGVDPEKIVPWDFLIHSEDDVYPPLKWRAETSRRLVYVGQLTREKGVQDAINAIATLRDQGLRIELTLVGKDHDGAVEKFVHEKGLTSHVHFAGVVAVSEIENFIRKFDAILVPSRHEYPEGFPLVLVHALRARLPIIASDHPMFSGVLHNDETAVVFSSGSHESLSKAIVHLLNNPALYEKISRKSSQIVRDLRVPTKFHDIIRSAFASHGAAFKFLESQALRRRSRYKIRYLRPVLILSAAVAFTEMVS